MMRARMATFAVDDPAKIDDEIATTRQYLADGRMPEGIPATGFLMLVDREGGRVIEVMLFENEGDLHRTVTAVPTEPSLGTTASIGIAWLTLQNVGTRVIGFIGQIVLAKILLGACRELAAALEKLPTFKDLDPHWIEIHRLENEGDRISRDAVASLFEDGIDPMVVIRWKDIFGVLEEAIDATETAAQIIEGIVIKNA